MGNLVVVAIPAEDDYVWKISSEKVPHITILYLGDATTVNNFAQMASFIQHATDTSMHRFGLEVDRRGVLGIDEADVLFFAKTRWSGIEDLVDFRSYLLKDDNVKAAYDSVEQFDGFEPHLTLGYPQTPAKPDNRDYPGISYISFDKIGLWFGDYSGLEFPLTTRNWDMEVSMTDLRQDRSRLVEQVLAHHGIKGMKWGVRRSDPGSSSAPPAHKDHVTKTAIGSVLKKHGTSPLSNDELRTYAERLQLEQNVGRLHAVDHKPSAGKKFIHELLSDVGKQQAKRLANQVATQQVDALLKKKAA